MTLLTKMLAALLLATGVLGAVLLHRNRVLGQKLQAEQARVQVLEHTVTATQNSLNTYMARAKATAERDAKRQKELTHVLEANRDWRDLPVPDDVYSGLYDRRDRATGTARGATR